jgi:ribonucleotide monophosphatase NagD (HAD superfamily)
VVGDCQDTLSYPLLDAAFRAVRAGAELLALQRGKYYLADDGPHLDTGAVVEALCYAADAKAHVLGKPSRTFFDAGRGPRPATEVVVVGDDRATDIRMGRDCGAFTVQVRTGKHADQTADTTLPQPDAVIGSVAALPDFLAART